MSFKSCRTIFMNDEKESVKSEPDLSYIEANIQYDNYNNDKKISTASASAILSSHSLLNTDETGFVFDFMGKFLSK